MASGMLGAGTARANATYNSDCTAKVILEVPDVMAKVHVGD